MNRDLLKHLTLIATILIVCSICSGCEQNNIIVLSDSSVISGHNQAVKCKNGAILVKINQTYNTTNLKNNHSEASIGEIKFGPKDISFDR